MISVTVEHDELEIQRGDSPSYDLYGMLCVHAHPHVWLSGVIQQCRDLATSDWFQFTFSSNARWWCTSQPNNPMSILQCHVMKVDHIYSHSVMGGGSVSLTPVALQEMSV